ncbi:hypothetical protein CK203_091030 [Vitis vinifera]|uniref:DUF4283 domain-containing protein n=1 Tax=Vitis vinifera TaxID=29760 RepID=A0A438BUX3_VITVI|nr:hypothetical protein CK203_091030 [Vitis vinifera]
MERKMLKVLVERKTFLIRLEGEQGGEWCSMTETSRGSIFALGFEKEAGPSDGSWLQQPWKVHKDRKIPEGNKGRGWENIKKALSSMLMVPYPNAIEKGRNIRGESWPHNNVGSMHRSYVKAVSDEVPIGGGLVPVGRWARAVRRLDRITRAAISPMVRGTLEEDCGAMGDVVIVVVGDEERRRGSEKGEPTQVAVASHSGTGGGRRGERGRSTTGGRYRVREDSRRRKEGERGKVVLTSADKRGKGCQLPSQSRLNSNKSADGLDGIEEAGGDWAGEDEAIADVGYRACERKAQSLAKFGPRVAIMGCKLKGPLGLGLSPEEFIPVETVASLRKEEDSSSANEKGKTTPRLLEVQSSRFAKKKVLYGSRKLWSTFFPPSSEHRQGIRCCNEPILRGKIKADSEEDPKAEALGAESQAKRGLSASPLFSCRFPRLRKKNLGEGASSPRNEEDLNNFSSNEDMEGFFGPSRV